MNTKPAVRVIRDKERRVPKIQARAGSAAGPNRWSAAVKSWIVEFRQRDQNETLPSFDSLFTDALESGRTD